MKKLFAVVAVAVLAAGCVTGTSPEVAGNFAGRAVYVTYSRVSDRQPESVRKAMEELWAYADSFDGSDARQFMECFSRKTDEVLAGADFTDSERKAVESIRDEVMLRLSEAAFNSSSAKNGMLFLKGMRDGIRTMISIEEAD